MTDLFSLGIWACPCSRPEAGRCSAVRWAASGRESRGAAPGGGSRGSWTSGRKSSSYTRAASRRTCGGTHWWIPHCLPCTGANLHTAIEITRVNIALIVSFNSLFCFIFSFPSSIINNIYIYIYIHMCVCIFWMIWLVNWSSVDDRRWPHLRRPEMDHG